MIVHVASENTSARYACEKTPLSVFQTHDVVGDNLLGISLGLYCQYVVIESLTNTSSALVVSVRVTGLTQRFHGSVPL